MSNIYRDSTDTQLREMAGRLYTCNMERQSIVAAKAELARRAAVREREAFKARMENQERHQWDT